MYYLKARKKDDQEKYYFQRKGQITVFHCQSIVLGMKQKNNLAKKKTLSGIILETVKRKGQIEITVNLKFLRRKDKKKNIIEDNFVS
jgi:hypothetical protein